MHYEADTSGIRDAKEAVDEAKRQIEIANIQKEIDLLEDQKELLNEQIDLLDERADAINKYYDEQIKKTEAFYDSQIKAIEKQRKETESYFESLTKSLETQKSKFQELTEILEKAELSAKLKQLGIDEEALLNGSEEEFEKLKNAYMDIIFKLNEGNDEVLNSLRELSGYDGSAPAMLEDSNGKLDEMNGKLDTSNQNVGTVNSSLGETAATTGTVASNVSDLSSNLNDVNGLITAEQTAFEGLKNIIDKVIAVINLKIEAITAENTAVATATGTEIANFQLLINKILEVKEKLDEINTTVATMNRQPIDNLANAFQLLYDKILPISALLGVGAEDAGEGVVSGIAGAIQALNDISLEEGIIAQFNNLKIAIDSVSSAISGGGSSGSKKVGDASTSSSPSMSSGANEDSKDVGNSLTGAINEMGETANEVIGQSDAEGDGTVIGEFGSMKTAVNEVSSAIGSGDENKENDGNLIGAIDALETSTKDTLGESGGDGVIGRFEELKQPIQEANEHVHSISDGLAAIDGQEVECTIKVNIETSGGTSFTEKTINCDRTYKTVIKRIVKKGYVILDETGNERTVGCCIPGVELKAGQSVWVKEPMGEIRNLHIVGVV